MTLYVYNVRKLKFALKEASASSETLAGLLTIDSWYLENHTFSKVLTYVFCYSDSMKEATKQVVPDMFSQIRCVWDRP